MTDTEFYSRLPDSARKPTEQEFDVIQFVYNYHPSFDCGNGKDKIANLYFEYGMRIILDMMGTAERCNEILEEKRKLKRQIEELDEEYAALKRGEPDER